MRRIFGNLKRTSSSSPSNYSDDSPEAIVLREVTAFCESGGPNSTNGNEFVHLPAIVESAESSPNAAKEAAHRIRKFLSHPASSGYIHYNAIMLFRILVDNPGHTFARNIDTKFVSTVRSLLRDGRDLNVSNFLQETLNALEVQRSWDEDLAPLIQMWKKEKNQRPGNARAPYLPPRPSPGQYQAPPGQQNYYANSQSRGGLPPPDELAARISEAKTSAKLLVQFVQSTPPAEIADHELIKEFADRCRSASRSIYEYIHATNPEPDEDTLLTLIETNDELSVSQSKYQRALLSARKAVGSSTPSSSSGGTASGARQVPTPPTAPAAPAGLVSPVSPVEFTPAPPVRRDTQTPSSPVSTLSDQDAPIGRYGSVVSNMSNSNAGRQEYRSEDFQVQNPFADSNTYTIPEHAEDHRDGWSNGAINDIHSVSRREV